MERNEENNFQKLQLPWSQEFRSCTGVTTTELCEQCRAQLPSCVFLLGQNIPNQVVKSAVSAVWSFLSWTSDYHT